MQELIEKETALKQHASEMDLIQREVELDKRELESKWEEFFTEKKALVATTKSSAEVDRKNQTLTETTRSLEYENLTLKQQLIESKSTQIATEVRLEAEIGAELSKTKADLLKSESDKHDAREELALTTAKLSQETKHLAAALSRLTRLAHEVEVELAEAAVNIPHYGIGGLPAAPESPSRDRGGGPNQASQTSLSAIDRVLGLGGGMTSSGRKQLESAHAASKWKQRAAKRRNASGSGSEHLMGASVVEELAEQHDSAWLQAQEEAVSGALKLSRRSAHEANARARIGVLSSSPHSLTPASEEWKRSQALLRELRVLEKELERLRGVSGSSSSSQADEIDSLLPYMDV